MTKKKIKINPDYIIKEEKGADFTKNLKQIIVKIRKFWKINPNSRIKKNKKKYNRKRAKQNLKKRMEEL